MRFAERDGKIICELHLRPADINELMVLRMQRSDRIKAINGKLVQCEKPLSLRLGRLTFHGIQMPDVVVHIRAVEYLQVLVVPANHLTVNIKRRVDDAILGVKGGMQRS